MAEILTNEMKNVIASLGALIKADSRCADIEKAIAEYEKSEELNGLIAEYNTQQNILADMYGKGETPDDEMRETIQARIDELYDTITTHPVYTAYLESKNAFDELTNEVYGELQFVITGKRPCSHDCSSCGGGCNH
ncbi:MAG: YlbF family regulator [Ruminococcaceae bacterium]|nr:YlbF family regulator [Oscillospiraceae bacterium]